MKQIKYRGRQEHFYLDLPRLSEPYLFKKSGGYESLVQDEDVKWLLVSHRDLFELIEEVPHGEETERQEEKEGPAADHEKEKVNALREMLVKVGKRMSPARR